MKILIFIFIGVFAVAKGLYPKLPGKASDEKSPECLCNGQERNQRRVHWPECGDVKEVRYYDPDSREHKSNEGCFHALVATIDDIGHKIKQCLKPNIYEETREVCKCCKVPFEPPTPKSILKKPPQCRQLPK